MQSIEPESLRFQDYLHILWRRKVYFLIPFLLVLAASAVVIVLIPPTYQSTGKILIESQQIPDDLVKSTISTYAGERIEIIKQRVMTRDRLLEIIEKYHLFTKARETRPVSEIVAKMRERVQINMISAATKGRRRDVATIAFEVAYQDRSPVAAQKVANELVTLFLAENVKVRTERAMKTTDFLRDEADKLKRRIDAMENRIAQYKQRRHDSLPEHLNLHVSQLERARQELRALKREQASIKEQLDTLEIELASARAGAPITSAAQADPNSPAARLQALKLQRLDLETRYQENHPDLVLVNRQIAALEAELAPSVLRKEIESEISELEQRLAEARQTFTDENPLVKRLAERLEEARRRLTESSVAGEGESAVTGEEAVPPSPAEGLIVAKINSLKIQQQTLAEDRAALEARVKTLEQSVLSTPETERVLQELSRDYEGAKQKYADLKSKEMEAAMAESLETGQKAERFILLEPPLRPEKPIKPNRPKLALLAILAALAAGAGVVYLVENMNSGIRSAQMLAHVAGMPPLVVIPYLENSTDRRRRRRNLALLWVFAIVTVIATLVAIHFLYKPLDILWYKALQAIQ